MAGPGEAPKIDDKFKDILTPSIADQELNLEELVSQGSISPEMLQSFLQDPSLMNDVSSDPASRQAQMDALMSLQEITEGGGLNASDRFNLKQIADQENANARGAREAIMQNAQARGQGGSGLSIMSQLKAQQDATSNQSNRDAQIAAQAQQRALEAMMMQGNLAGSINSREFQQDQAKAQAQDAINQFNTQNKQSVAGVNNANINNAQAQNLMNKQNIANSNVATRNNQQTHNKNLIQQDFNNKISKAGGSQNVANQNAANAAANSQAQANATNQNIATAASLAGGGIYAAAAMKAAEEAKKNQK